MEINSKVISDYINVDCFKDWASVKAVILREPLNGYLGWAGYGNLGDEAVYEAYVKLFGNKKLTDFRISRPVKYLCSLTHREVPFNFVALGGGTLINQNRGFLDHTKYLLDHNVPMFCMGTGVASRSFWKDRGSIHTAENIDAWADLLKRFAFVGVRGPMSQKTLVDAGVQAEIVGDAALALTKEKYVVRNNRKIIGVNLSYGTDGVMWGEPALLVSEMIKSINAFLNQGFEVRLLPIWKPDLALSKQVCLEVNNPRCKVVNEYSTTEAYLTALEKCDLFIGLKLHATIFATMLRIPSIMLEYRPKCLDYMKSIGMESYSVRTDMMRSDLLNSKISELIEHYDYIVSTLDKKVLYYKNLQHKTAGNLLEEIFVH